MRNASKLITRLTLLVALCALPLFPSDAYAARNKAGEYKKIEAERIKQIAKSVKRPNNPERFTPKIVIDEDGALPLVDSGADMPEETEAVEKDPSIEAMDFVEEGEAEKSNEGMQDEAVESYARPLHTDGSDGTDLPEKEADEQEEEQSNRFINLIVIIGGTIIVSAVLVICVRRKSRQPERS